MLSLALPGGLVLDLRKSSSFCLESMKDVLRCGLAQNLGRITDPEGSDKDVDSGTVRARGRARARARQRSRNPEAVSLFRGTPDQVRGSSFGPGKRSHFWDRYLQLVKKTGPFSGPKTGAAFRPVFRFLAKLRALCESHFVYHLFNTRTEIAVLEDRRIQLINCDETT